MSIEVRTQSSKLPKKEFPIDMVILKDLVPHEMTIDYELKNLKAGIVKSKRLFWPLLVDKSSMLLLDGHHRTKGLIELDYINAPAVYLDYFDDNLIKVDTWYPLLLVPVEEIIEELESKGFKITVVDNIDLIKIKNREFTGIIGNGLETYYVSGDREEMFASIRENWLHNIKYFDDANECLKASNKDSNVIISWSYTKQEIIDHVKKGEIFLPKTTRHFMKYDIMKCNFPLDKLEKK